MNKSTQLVLCFLNFSFSLTFSAQIKKNSSIQNIYFKENKGQISDQNCKPRPDVLFSGQSGQLNFHLKAKGISYQLMRVDSWKKEEALPNQKSKNDNLVPDRSTLYRIDINWLNATSTEIKKGEPLSGYDNYYLATCPEGALNVRSYSSILYKNIYPGIDLKWYQKDGSLKYDYYVAAFTDYKQIKIDYNGAENISINAEGELIIQTPLGNLIEQKPLVFQNGKILEASWMVSKNVVSFSIKDADPSKALIIDPLVRLWATFYGGAGEDYVSYTTTDNLANLIVSGKTKSFASIATSGSHQTNFAGVSGGDACLVKFDQNGSRVWATYYGGTKDDYGLNCKTNSNNEIYFTGTTSSTNTAVFATTGAHQPTCSLIGTNTSDAFLVKFDAAGIRQWGTYYGGDKDDWSGELSLDNSGNVFISGMTSSTNNIATSASHQTALLGTYDAYLAKFNSSGVRQWGTYYGGNGNSERGTSTQCDVFGDVYLGGFTNSTNGIATTNAHQPTNGGGTDGFLAKFNTNGTRTWGTYYGDTGNDDLFVYASDASGNIYCSGSCSSGSSAVFATPACHQSTFGGGNSDMFIIKFDPSGQRLFGTFYGGTGDEGAGMISLNSQGELFVCSASGSTNGSSIATPCSYQSVFGGGSADLFLVKMTSNGARIWATYYGGIYTDYDQYCAVDNHDNVYISGTTLAGSSVIPSSNGFQTSYGGGPADGLVVKFASCTPVKVPDLTPPSNLSLCKGDTTILLSGCGNWYSSLTSTTIIHTGSSYTTGPIVSDTTLYVDDISCGTLSGTRTAISLTVLPAPTVSITNSNPLACVQWSVTLTASGASTYSWINSSTSSSTYTFYVLLNTTYSVTGTDANGCTSTATLAVVPNLCLGLSEYTTIAQISIFPNPNKGQVTIRSGEDLNLMLVNQLGQNMLSLILNSENGYEINLRNLPNGIYFLKNEKDQSLLNKKIVVLN